MLSLYTRSFPDALVVKIERGITVIKKNLYKTRTSYVLRRVKNGRLL